MIKIKQIVEKYFFEHARIMTGSKSAYLKAHPNNVAVFNANLIILSRNKPKKIWHGDLDLTIDLLLIVGLQAFLKQDLYVFSEMNFRFETEQKPDMTKYLIRIADNEVTIGPIYLKYIEIQDTTIRYKNAR